MNALYLFQLSLVKFFFKKKSIMLKDYIFAASTSSASTLESLPLSTHADISAGISLPFAFTRFQASLFSRTGDLSTT